MRRDLSLSPGEWRVLGLVIVLAAVLLGYWRGVVDATDKTRRALAVNPLDATELKALETTYGPAHNSEGPEEWIVRDFFKDARGGMFVDVGANHHQHLSNTYYLETTLGWTGVAIEPQKKFAEGWATFRPKTTFFPLFVSDVSNREATIYLSENDLVTSSSREFTEAFGPVTPSTAPTTTLDDILDRLRITRVDFLSMDIELAEPQALAGFSIDRFRPRLAAVEAHPPVRQQILDYFTRHQYSLVGKYWRLDGENFWFAPVVP